MAAAEQGISRVISPPRIEEAERMTAGEIRASFLLERVFREGDVCIAYVCPDRFAVGGAAPIRELPLTGYREFGTGYFTERRELGILNVGSPGAVAVGGRVYALETMDCLYVGVGEPEIVFLPGGSGQALYYFLSCLAHTKYPTAVARRAEAAAAMVGDEAHATKRCIRKCIHPGGLASCQLMMGFTELADGSVWNTMAPHTHDRRTEVYFYFDLEDEVVVHLMGRPESTRSIIVRDRQAVISPGWSLHAGAGTRRYSFVWGMAGENQDFDDMDLVGLQELY